jgi:hypothetical protein
MFESNQFLYWLVTLLVMLIGFTARSYRTVVLQSFAVAICYLAARYVLGVHYQLAPEALGPLLDGVVVALANIVSILGGSSVCWAMVQWWRRRPHPTVHELARLKIERARAGRESTKE